MTVIVNAPMEADLSEWTSETDADGHLDWAAAAGLAGSAGGMALEVADNNVMYCEHNQSTSSTTGKCRIRLYLDPNTMTMAGDNNFIFLYLMNSSAGELFRVVLYYDGGYYITAKYFHDASNADTGYYNITDVPHYIEIYLTRAATTSSNDGTFQLWIDGTSKFSATNLDNNGAFANWDKTQVGAVAGIDTGTRGTFYIDEVVGNDDGTLIGGKTYISLSGAVTSAGVVIKSGRKVLSGAVTSAGALILSARKVLAGAVTSAGELATELIEGAGEYFQELAGTLTSSGVLVKLTARSLSGAVTSAGILVKRTARALAGAVTSAGVVLKRGGKVLAGALTFGNLDGWYKDTFYTMTGALTPSGNVIKRTSKVLAGAVTSAGVLLKTASKVLSGALTSAGVLLKQAGKVLSGAVTSAGELIGTFISGAILYFQDVSGVLSSAGSLTKQTARSLAGALTSAGVLLKSTAKALSGALTSGGTLVKMIARAMSGALTSGGVVLKSAARALGGALGGSGVLVNRAGKVLSGALSSAGVVTKGVFKVLAGALSSSGVLALQTAYARAVGGALVMGGDVVKSTSKLLSGAVAMGGGIVKSVLKVLSGALSGAGDLISNLLRPTPEKRKFKVQVDNRVDVVRKRHGL